MEKASTFVIILNYNSAEDAVGLFKNLLKFHEQFLHILIVDNASAPQDQEVLITSIPENNLMLLPENLGYAGGNNIAIKKALKENASYIWILNPDIRVERETLPILLDTLAHDPNLAAVNPRIVKREHSGVIFSDGEMLCVGEGLVTTHKNHGCCVNDLEGKIDYNVDYLDGSTIFLNSRAVKEIGYLEEEYFLYFEETDWCYRAKIRGWKIAVNSKAVVYNLTSEKAGIFHFYMMRNKMIFSKKHLSSFHEVRKFYIKSLFQEILNRFRGKYFKPFFINRFKGLISGIIKTTI